MTEADLTGMLESLWRRLGATRPPHTAALLAAWNEPHRAYHRLEHLVDCLDQFAAVRLLAKRPDEVEAAIWFHDYVYDLRRGDNEERSAKAAQAMLEEAGVAKVVAMRVAELVLATKHQAVPTDPDAALLVDIDLSILGREPDAFDAYEAKIRQEYAWVPEADFRRGRAEILRRFLERSAIFSTPTFRQRYETRARANLARSMARGV